MKFNIIFFLDTFERVPQPAQSDQYKYICRFVTPLKNPARRAGGTKPEALVPEALRDGFLRGV